MKAEALRVVEVLDRGVLVANAIVGDDGKWSADIAGLGSGSHVLTAREIGTNLKSEDWEFTVGSRTQFEDFETGIATYPNFSPVGTILNFPTMDVIVKSGQVAVYYIGESYAPYISAKVIYLAASASVTILLKIPAKEIKFGIVDTARAPSDVSCYDADDNLLISGKTPPFGSAYAAWATFITPGAPIKKIIIGNSGRDTGIDNFTMTN